MYTKNGFSYIKSHMCVCVCVHFVCLYVCILDKYRILFILLQGLPREVMNYGLYMPPTGGKPGKFLDETRLLVDYAPHGKVFVLKVCLKVCARIILNSISP